MADGPEPVIHHAGWWLARIPVESWPYRGRIAGSAGQPRDFHYRGGKWQNLEKRSGAEPWDEEARATQAPCDDQVAWRSPRRPISRAAPPARGVSSAAARGPGR